MELTPYLNFDGTCNEAFRFYERVFGGKIEQIHTFGEIPGEPVPPELRDRVMHVRLTIGNNVLMGSDTQPGQYVAPAGLFISINVASKAEGEQIFKALSEGGTVTMPFEPTFWSPGFGMVTDRFGTPWMVNTGEAPKQ